MRTIQKLSTLFDHKEQERFVINEVGGIFTLYSIDKKTREVRELIRATDNWCEVIDKSFVHQLLEQLMTE